eukprot:SAG31_NODE_30315_length_382_cov_20.749117_1_plen_48_part_01
MRLHRSSEQVRRPDGSIGSFESLKADSRNTKCSAKMHQYQVAIVGAGR